MRILTTSLLFTALLGLGACEPKGPAADIGDHIDQVKDNAAQTDVTNSSTQSTQQPLAPSAEPLRPEREVPLEPQAGSVPSNNTPSTTDEATNSAPPRPERTPTYSSDTLAPNDAPAPAAEVIEEQKKQLAEANKAASEEADQKLNEILEETANEP